MENNDQYAATSAAENTLPAKEQAPQEALAETIPEMINDRPEVTQHENTSPQTPLATGKKISFIKRNMKLVIIASLVAILAFVLGVFLLTKNKENNKIESNAGNNQAASDSTDVDKKNSKEPMTGALTGSVFFDTPKKIDNLKLSTYENGSSYNADEYSPLVSYYHIGDTKDDRRIIVYYTDTQSIEGAYGRLLIENSTQEYRYLTLLNNSAYYADDYTSAVIEDADTTFTELAFPAETVIDGLKVKTSQKLAEFDPTNTPTGDEKIADMGSYAFYKDVTDKTTYSLVSFSAAFKNFYVTYIPNDELSSQTTVMPIAWSSGEKTAIKAFSGGAGCGSSGYVITKADRAILSQVGLSTAGTKIYQLPANNALVTLLYKEYNQYPDNIKENLRGFTVQKFSDYHGYFIAENALGDLVVYQRDDMYIRGGCGKPVVYLYPTTTTSVNVRVGASVVISEPLYEKDGWRNVIAQPNGQLSYRGKAYDSLYWEGYGDGKYPAITEGTVVASSQAAQKIADQLSEQGFNAKETADFLAFWKPKLPTTPYIRLTWIGTKGMDTLAPLTISPAPQTVIRTFLDFEGLQKPISLKKQSFTAPARSGFTVTEWGGLLREGIR